MQQILFFLLVFTSIVFIVIRTISVIKSKKVFDEDEIDLQNVSESKPLVLFFIPLLISVLLLLNVIHDNSTPSDSESLKNTFLGLVSICGYYSFMLSGIKAFFIKIEK